MISAEYFFKTQHILFALLSLHQVMCGNDELELLSYLFNSTRYSPSVRPRINSTDHVELTLTWSTAYILGLDNKEALFTQSAVLNAEWSDDFLIWNPVSFGGIQSIVVPGEYIWTPRITILNQGNSAFLKEGFSNDQIRIHSDGTVKASHSGIIDVVCTTDARQFPFDDQMCSILMQSGVYINSEIRLKFSPIGIIYYSYGVEEGHPIWNVKEFTKEVVSYNHMGDVAFIVFHLQRKSLYYACTMIAPSAILSILTLGAFFIPNDSGEKLSCGLALFLSFVVFLIQIGDIVPENSNGNSVIVVHYMLCMIGSGIFILHSIVQIMLIKHKIKLCQSKSSQPQVVPIPPKEKDGVNLPYLITDGIEEKNHSLLSSKFRKKCSLILFTDILSFIVSLVLNLAGYGLLLDTYMSRA